MQAFLREYLTTPITVDNIDDAEFLSEEQGVPLNRKGWIESVQRVHAASYRWKSKPFRKVPSFRRVMSWFKS